MKTFYQAFLAGFLALATLPYAEAARASSLKSAYDRANDRAIVVFCYGANFSPINLSVYEEYMRRRKLMRGLTATTYVELPVWQLPDDKEQKLQDKALGGAKLPKIRNLPSILIMDGDKVIRGSIQDPEYFQDAEKANKLLAEKLEVFKKQQLLLNSAGRFKTSKKAELVAQAADLGLDDSMEVPSDFNSAAAAVGKDGYPARFSFDWEKMQVDIDKLDNQGAINYIQSRLKNDKLTVIQKQELLCLLTGHLRRNNMNLDKLREFYQEMNLLKPDSMYGAYAEECIRTYCQKKPE